MEFLNWITEHSIAVLTSLVTVASIVARITPNQTDNIAIANLQKVVDIVAMSSKPTEHISINLNKDET